jgi:hypothetical protein
MNFDFQQILKRIGLLMGEMPLIKSGVVVISGVKLVGNGQIGLNCAATVCERKTFANFGRWIPQKMVKPSQTQSNPVRLNPTKSNLIQPNPTNKMAWAVPAWCKTATEACNP